MSPAEAWQANNTRYVAGAVSWIRARLEALLATRSGATGDSPQAAPRDIAAARAVMDKHAGNRTHRPAMMLLAEQLGLSPFEQEVLLLCTAVALDPGLPALCAAATESGRPGVSFALALRLFDEPAWAALAPSGPLRHWRLIEIHQAAGEPLIAAALRADERIVNYVKGLNEPDDRVESWLKPLRRAGTSTLPGSHLELCDRLEASIRFENRSGNPSLVQLLGAHALSKKEVASEVSHRLGTNLWQLTGADLAALSPDWDTFSRLLVREGVLLGAALYIDCDELEPGSEAPTSPLPARTFERLSGMLVFLAVRDRVPALDRAGLQMAVPRPTISEQRLAWLELVGDGSERSASVLAGQFDLDIPLIERVVARVDAAAAVDDGAGDPTVALWREARDAVRPLALGLATRVDARAAWPDLVLAPEQRRLLEEMTAQVQHQWTVYQRWGFGRRLSRGLGISALFCGESGTGKTMSAEVIANQVDLDLYRIDLASVVSKYVGETEKNLRRVFDAFDDGGAILFFDEADALFGKRSEVRDSHDRYANIEINYLLQRMEAYRGLVILATNRKTALDQAFLRRLRFVVDFPYPGVAERALIWRRVFPPETPVDDLDVERLAGFGLAGGNIQSVALNAAFRAASESRRVGMKDVLACARAELVKLGLPVRAADFEIAVEARTEKAA